MISARFLSEYLSFSASVGAAGRIGSRSSAGAATTSAASRSALATRPHMLRLRLSATRTGLIGPDRESSCAEFVPVRSFSNDMIVAGAPDILGDRMIHTRG